MRYYYASEKNSVIRRKKCESTEMLYSKNLRIMYSNIHLLNSYNFNLIIVENIY